MIVNGKGRTVFDWSMEKVKSFPKRPKRTLTSVQLAHLNLELRRTGVSMDEVQKRFDVAIPEEMSIETYERVRSALAKTKTKQVA